MNEEEIVFTLVGLILTVMSLGFFKINIILAIIMAVFCVAFWWTLFFVLLG